MTKEERRVYMHEYRIKNRDRIREQKRTAARLKALADMESVKVVPAHVCVIHAADGRVYVVGGDA